MNEGMTFTGDAKTAGEMAGKAVTATVDTLIQQGLKGATVDVTGPKGEIVTIEIKIAVKQ